MKRSYTKEQHTQVVTYEEGEAGADRPEIGFTFDADLSESEIIGNIHENQELLK